MPPEVIAALEPVLKSGPVAALLILAVWWLTKGNEKLVTALNTERKERLDSLTQQVDKLEKRSDDCEKDRLNLHRLLAEVTRSTH
jgi:septal ring factor EnvC (AmiA/AmiB activator)